MNDQRGVTLIEVVITLGIIGMLTVTGIYLGSSLKNSLETHNFDAECKVALSQLIRLQNEAIMSDAQYGNYAQFFEDQIFFATYDVSIGDYTLEVMDIKHAILKGNLKGKKLTFNTSGTVDQGGTLDFFRNGHRERSIIVQIGNGRIYLTDE